MDYARLRAAALQGGGDEEAVTVDTRALIDKVLARYSGEWTTLRELIQNAADAQATTVRIRWETLPSTQVPLPAIGSDSDMLKHIILHHTLRRLVVQNNGQPFNERDWARLKRIAEGNPDETKIGAFGVGFYSVFADCEEPFVSSGNEALAFYWKGNALFTRKLQLPHDQQSSETAFVLDYRNTTTPVPNLLSVGQFLATSLTFVALHNIEFWIDDWKILDLRKKASPSQAMPIPRSLETKTSEGLMTLVAVERSSTQIDARFMNAIGWKSQAAAASTKSNDAYSARGAGHELTTLKTWFSRLTASSSQMGLHGKAAKEEQAMQEAIAEDLTAKSSSSIFLRHTTGHVATKVATAFATELERATKKPPPKTTRLSILTSSYDETMASEASGTAGSAKVADVFASVLPSKKPGGRIFIGFPTTQTTGAGMHISAPSVIPTVEREAIDLNARWVRTWNMEMLRVAGIMSRLAFSNEMLELNEKLKHMGESKTRKGAAIALEHVKKCIPEALHILQTYSFQDATPNSLVGKIIEEAFWLASKHAAVEVYSSRGVLTTDKVRTSSDEIAKFVGGIPVILEEMRNAPFIKKVIDFGLVQDITVSDIRQELETTPLEKEQLRNFVVWIAKGASTKELDPPSVRQLLDVAVAAVGDKDGSGDIIALGSIGTYHNRQIPHSLPTPPTTMPVEFTAGIPEVQLQALGWQPLAIPQWVRFLIQSGPSIGDQYNVSKSEAFAIQVLTTLSKSWDNLSPQSKHAVGEALEHVTIMPTKMGMRKPAESFFPSVNLFDDLPTLKGCQGLKEKFLLGLGVRKTVDLDTIFTRLLSPTSAADGTDGHAKWSHMQLIRYLASVKDDIPAADMKKLKQSPLCPAEAGPEGMENTKWTTRRYKVSELYEPKSELRPLKLPLIQWSGPSWAWKSDSAEGRFLRELGLMSHPPVDVLVDLMALPDRELAKHAMDYFIVNHYQYYSSCNISVTNKAILPLQGNEKKLVPPSACYADEKAAVLGFYVLSRALVSHADKFGVSRNPPIHVCVERLISNPPRDHAMAVTLFEYFLGRVSELASGQLLKRLGSSPIIPVFRKSSKADGKSETTLSMVRPVDCYLGDSSTFGEIFDFVNFGTGANTFLLRCGAKNEPTKPEIAEMACSEPARLLGVMQSPDKYLGLLRSLADDMAMLRSDSALWKKMKTSAWLLGFRELSSEKSNEDDEDGAPVRHYQLASPTQIVVLDDFIAYRLFKKSLLCAPEEDNLEAFYMALGSEQLGSKVEEQIRFGAHSERQDGALWLRKHVIERSKLFLYEYSKYKKDAIKRDTAWLEKNLQVQAVRSLTLQRSLKGYNQVHTEKRTAASACHQKQWILFVAAADDARPDMYQVGQAICQLLLNRPNQQAFLFFEPFLKLDLLDLRARGYNVDRILRAKAAEAKIAEEQRRKALEEEQRIIREKSREWEKQAAAEVAAKTPDRRRMPGSFHDSPEEELPNQGRPQNAGGLFDKSLFDNLSRSLGFGSNIARDRDSNINNTPLPAPNADTKDKHLLQNDRRPDDDGRVTSPAVVQQNLLNAIRSTRAHDSSHLFAPPTQGEVKEQATYCDSTPAQNIRFVATAPQGMRLFLDKDLRADTGAWLQQHLAIIRMFETVLGDVGEVYGLSSSVMHMFYDEKGGTIAFNNNGSIFCNLRFFLQLHISFLDLPGRQPAMLQGQQRADATIWWWVVVAHELAHNLVKVHDSQHSYYSESFVQQYFGKMMRKANAIIAAANMQHTPVAPGGSSLPPPPPYS